MENINPKAYKMIIQLCGLSGAGKSTIAQATYIQLLQTGIDSEIIDGDEYRKTLCKGLSFSKNDRIENTNRLAFVAARLSAHGIIAIISAINPYEEMRQQISHRYTNVKTVYIHCSIAVLQKRDTRGLYKKAFLPDSHPEKVKNLSGVNDPFDIPRCPDLILNTELFSKEQCAHRLFYLFNQNIKNRPTLIKPLPDTKIY